MLLIHSKVCHTRTGQNGNNVRTQRTGSHTIAEKVSCRNAGNNTRLKLMKRLVEECFQLNMNDLIRAGVFTAPCSTPCDIQWRDTAGQLLLTVNFWRETSPVSALRVAHTICQHLAEPVSYVLHPAR